MVVIDRLARVGRIKLATASLLAVSNVLAAAKPDLPWRVMVVTAVATFFACYVPLLLCAVLSELRGAGQGDRARWPGGDRRYAAQGALGGASSPESAAELA
jgi:hypothetical protein